MESMMGFPAEDASQEAGIAAETPEAAPTPAAPPAPNPEQLLQTALQTVNALASQNETLQKRLNDQRSWFDKRFNEVQKQISSRPSPSGEDDWSGVLNDPEKLSDFFISKLEQAGFSKQPALTEEDIAFNKTARVVNEFQAKHPESRFYEPFIHSHVSKLVDNPSQITERMLKAGLDLAIELGIPKQGAQAPGNRPEAGNVSANPSNEAANTDASAPANSAPVNISGSGMSGAARPRAKTLADLKQLARKVDWSKTE